MTAPDGGDRAVVSTVLGHVAAAWGVDRADCILSDRQDHAVLRSRQAIAWLLRNRFNQTLPRIAQAINRDASTVRHTLRRAADLRAGDPDFRARLAEVEGVLDQPQGGSE